MTTLKRLDDLNRFLHGCMNKKKWEDGNTLPIKLGFGVTQEGDELVDLDSFINTPLDEDRLILSCVKVDEPVEKEDKKMKSTTSKSAATLFDNFLNKACLDESSPLHNGHIQEMRVLILRGTIIQRDKMKVIKDIENGDEFATRIAYSF